MKVLLVGRHGGGICGCLPDRKTAGQRNEEGTGVEKEREYINSTTAAGEA